MVDSSQFNGPLQASRKEVAAAKRAMRDALTPMQQYENKQKELANLRAKNLINDQQFTAGLEKARQKFEQLTGVTDRQRRAESLMTTQRQKANSIIDSQRTATQRLQTTQADLNRLVRRGLLTERQRRQELKRVRRELGKTTIAEKAMGAARSRAGAVGGLLLGGGAAAMGISAFNNARAEIDTTAKFARQIDFNIEKLIQFQTVAARSSGMGADAFNMAMQRMTRRTSEAAAGTGEAVGAMRELNLNAEEMGRLSPDQMFLRYADALDKVENQSDRNRLAMKLFDTEGVKLINTMKGGSRAILSQAAAANALGNTVSKFDAANVETMNDAIDDVKTSLSGVAREFTTTFAPMITDAAKQLSLFIRQSRIKITGQDTGASDLTPAAKRALELRGMSEGALKRMRQMRVQEHARDKKRRAERKKAQERSDKALLALPGRLVENAKSKFRSLRQEFNNTVSQHTSTAAGMVSGFLGQADRRRQMLSLQSQIQTDTPDALQAGSAEAFRFLNQVKPVEQQQLNLTQEQVTQLKTLNDAVGGFLERFGVDVPDNFFGDGN